MSQSLTFKSRGILIIIIIIIIIRILLIIVIVITLMLVMLIVITLMKVLMILRGLGLSCRLSLSLSLSRTDAPAVVTDSRSFLGPGHPSKRPHVSAATNRHAAGFRGLQSRVQSECLDSSHDAH